MMKKYSEPSATLLTLTHEDILSTSNENVTALGWLAQEDGCDFGDFNMFS